MDTILVTILEALEESNGRLKAQNIRLTIEIKDRSLYLPPRPGSGKTEQCLQMIALGISATYQGIKLAEAQKISIRLLACNFGASDPGNICYAKFGFTVENLLANCRQLLG